MDSKQSLAGCYQFVRRLGLLELEGHVVSSKQPGVEIERLTRIRYPRHRWSHEVWDASAAESKVILKSCLWGNPKSPFLPVRRNFLRREARILEWVQQHCPEAAPGLLHYDSNQMVMERLTGPDFFTERALLEGNGPVWERLAGTVKKMHDNGIAHGEVRLGNIMFDNDQVKFVDFATACTRENALYAPMRWMDQMAILWMKVNIFRLPLESEEIRIQNKHVVFHRFFVKYIACDIPYA